MTSLLGGLLVVVGFFVVFGVVVDFINRKEQLNNERGEQ